MTKREGLDPGFSQRVEQAAETAMAGSRPIERAFRFHDQEFVMRFSGETIAARMTRAFQHLAIPQAEHPALTIHCWDVKSTGVSFPMPECPPEFFTGRGEIQWLDSPAMRVAYFDWIQLWNLYSPGKKSAYYCLPDADHFPIQQLGSPALTLFNWWLGHLGWQFSHAAAVGTARGGVLIVGHGGAGKSTLTFSTLGTPLRYISDDYCVLVPGQPPEVWALYNSGKLTEDSLTLLPHLRERTANADDPAREKALFFLHEQFPGKQLSHAPIRAVVLPQLGKTETSLQPVNWHEVVTILADSTLRQLAGSHDSEFLRLARLIRHLPAYRLKHGSDTSTTHRLLLDLCAS